MERHLPALDPAFNNVWDELKWRGLVHVSTNEDQLKEMLAGEPVGFYCGFDPTAESLHLGHLVQLVLLRRLQLAGHRPFALVGGATGLIGDPRPTAERTLNDEGVVADWVEKIKNQVAGYLSFEGENPAEVVNNLDWTENLSAIDFLRGVGKHFRVGTMLKKDAVATRLASEEGISYTEFSYQILQGHDFLQLFKRHGVMLQTGGSDQWGNLVAGIDLVHKVEGVDVHAIGTPLLTSSDGRKFSKSEGTAIWINAEATSPYAFYQFWLNTTDEDVISRLKVFTFLNSAEIGELEKQVEAEPFKRAAQKVLAFEACAIVHGEEATRAAMAASEALFGGGELTGIDLATLNAVAEELPVAEVREGELITDALVLSGLTSSASDARRAIAQGGVYLNNKKVDAETASFIDADFLHSEVAILRRGKKSLAAVRLAK